MLGQGIPCVVDIYWEKSFALFQSAIRNETLLQYTLLTFSLFYCFAGFPPVGYLLVDGTYIKITPKAEDSNLYTCRKWFHALNVMMFTSKWYFYYKYEPIQMQHWRPKATDGAKFWTSCKRPAFLRTFSRLQMIQNKRPWCCGAAYVEAG